jgi:hypothetical protein
MLSFGIGFQHLKTPTTYNPTSTLYETLKKIYERQSVPRTAGSLRNYGPTPTGVLRTSTAGLPV